MHSRKSNLEKGTLPYMAPELILNNLEGASVEDLKSINVGSGNDPVCAAKSRSARSLLIEHEEKALNRTAANFGADSGLCLS